MYKRTEILIEILKSAQRTCFAVDSEVYELLEVEKHVNKLKRCYGIEVEVKKVNDEVIIVSNVIQP